MGSYPSAGEQLSIRRIFNTWWPLALSWLLMGAELPVLSAVVARLPDPEINLAAYGGIVFPLALIVESPVIMLLAASTALCKDWSSYQLIRRFTIVIGAVMTAVHVLVAFTPLYYVVAGSLLGVPEEIIQPGRIGLMLMTPWTWSIAYRRFNQGVLIRFGHSRTISIGTGIRLATNAVVLTIGYIAGSVPGIVVASLAVASGVISEAVYTGIVVRPVLVKELRPSAPVVPALTLRVFLAFYIPLAMTSLLFLLSNPMGSAAISRMPLALESLAVWPVVSGLVFMFRSLGVAYNEVVVALIDERGSFAGLRRFTSWLVVGSVAALILLAITPMSTFWFGTVSALSPELASMARLALFYAMPLPVFAVLQSWYQGAILHGRQTRGVTEAVILYRFVSAVLYPVGVLWGGLPGLYVGLGVLGLSMAAQTGWLYYRIRLVLSEVRQRDMDAQSPFSVDISGG